MLYNFPETKFSKDNTVEQQLDHVRSEVDEAGAEFCYMRTKQAMMECIDVIHSAETMLRILVNMHGEEKVAKAIEITINKNRDRGYYD